MKNNLLWEIFLFICAATCIAPFLVLGFFCHPAVDDFSFVQTVYQHGFFGAHLFWYTQWSGRFVSNGLLCIHPLLLGSIIAYKVTLCCLLLVSVVALYRLIDTVAGKSICTIRKTTFALSIGALYLYTMPSVVQAVYWLPGVVSYQVSPVLLLLSFSAMIRYSKISTDSPGRRRWLWTATVILFLSLCCNESFTAAVFVILGCVVLGQLFTYRKISTEVLCAIGAFVTAVSIELLAPGNYVRLAESPVAKSVWKTMLQSAQIAGDNIQMWTVTGAAGLAVAAAALLTFGYRTRLDLISKAASLNPLIVLAASIAIQIAVIFPCIYINGEAPGRVFNTAWFFWLCSIILTAMCGTGWILRRRFCAGTSAKVPRILYLILAGCIGVSLLIPNNISIAYREILTGEAVRYEQAQQRRYRQMAEFTGDTCVVAPISPQPRHLFFGDITKQADSWQNTPYAEYFKIKNVTLGF